MKKHEKDEIKLNNKTEPQKVVPNININMSFNHCQSVSDILSNSFNVSGSNKIVVYTDNKENFSQNVMNQNNGDFLFDSEQVVSDIVVDEEADENVEESPSDCIVANYVAQNSKLDKYKPVIKNFLLKSVMSEIIAVMNKAIKPSKKP